jgi:uncharacterized protein YigA (DUF484 family)
MKQIEESDIIEWLQANPDLFSRHPELVDDLNCRTRPVRNP